MPDLDLAFDVADGLPASLLAAAGPCSDPLAGAEHWHQRISDWLDQLAAELEPALRHSSYSLGLSVVTDAAIAELNQDWRQVAGPTDVLAFAAQEQGLAAEPALPSHQDLPLELGDIVISLETAARQAPDHAHSLEQEMLFLASHGLLHLLGWDHPDEAALAAMLSRQQRLLAAE